MSTVVTRTPGPQAVPLRWPGRGRALLREVALLTALLAGYDLVRLLAARRVAGAYDSAHRLWDLERWLRLPSEQHLQSLALGVPDLPRAANAYYAGVHFPLTLAVLAWLFLRRPAAYLWARRALVTATAAGLVVEVLLPTAPPRMLVDLGFVDTGLAYGQSVYGAVGKDRLANQFAALPSLHVGWALLVAVVLIRTGHARRRWLWALHPALTVLVVVVTGNHYWLDGLLGAALVLAALAGRRAAAPARPGAVDPAGAAPHGGCAVRRRCAARRAARRPAPAARGLCTPYRSGARRHPETVP